MCESHIGLGPMGSITCDACSDQISKNWEKHLNSTPVSFFYSMVYSSQELEVKTNLAKNVKKFLWITINPITSVSTPTFLQKIHKMYSKKWIRHKAYMFELGNNGRQHSHGLILIGQLQNRELNKKVGELKNTVKNISDIDNDHCVCIRYITEEQAEKCFKYMLGTKVHHKMDAVQKSKQWREENAIDELYGGIKTLLAPV